VGGRSAGWRFRLAILTIVVVTMVWLCIGMSARRSADGVIGDTPSEVVVERGSLWIRGDSRAAGVPLGDPSEVDPPGRTMAISWIIDIDFDNSAVDFDANCPFLIGFGGAEGPMLRAIERAAARGLPLSASVHELLADYLDVDPSVAGARWRTVFDAARARMSVEPSESNDVERVVAGLQMVLVEGVDDPEAVRSEVLTFLDRWPRSELAPPLAWWVLSLSPRIDEPAARLLTSGRGDVAKEAAAAAACSKNLLRTLTDRDLLSISDRLDPSHHVALLNIAEALRQSGRPAEAASLVGRALLSLSESCHDSPADSLIESAPDGSFALPKSLTCREVHNAARNAVARDPSFPLPGGLDEREIALRRSLLGCEASACGRVKVVRVGDVPVVEASGELATALASCVLSRVDAVLGGASKLQIDVTVSGTSGCPAGSASEPDL
jgi:hypothetical protein